MVMIGIGSLFPSLCDSLRLGSLTERARIPISDCFPPNGSSRLPPCPLMMAGGLAPLFSSRRLDLRPLDTVFQRSHPPAFFPLPIVSPCLPVKKWT